MPNREANPKGILDILSLIHFAMTFGLFAIGIFFYWLGDDWVVDYSNMGYKLPYAVPISAILGIIAGRLLFSRHMISLKTADTLGAKLNGYMTASLVKFACYEAPGFFGLFAAQETGNMAYLVITGLVVLMLAIERPTKQRVETDLQLNGELKREFEKAMKVQ